ncbi:MAG: SGNH/GDSL hydrolase family protein [Phycisphaerae bacterium]
MRVALFFADGRAYFLGIALVIIGLLVMAAGKKRKPSKRIRIVLMARVLLIAGALFILLSATPAPIWFYGLWFITIVAWLIHQSEPMLKCEVGIALRIGSLLLCLAAAGMEIRYRLMPKLERQGQEKVYIVGDSLSAGMGTGETTWPKLLAAGAPVEVIDLSVPGATAGTAMQQAKQVPQGPAVVVIEIGGNDLLGGTPARAFESDLRRLLQTLSGDSRRLVMFELPLPPFFNKYGRVQRRLASEFDVALIPKSVLTEVIGTARGTLDGLHLSDQGHRTIAETVRRVINLPEPSAAPASSSLGR